MRYEYDQGQWYHSHVLLKKDAIVHFFTLIKGLRSAMISDHLKVIKHYPSIFTREEAMAIDSPMTRD